MKAVYLKERPDVQLIIRKVVNYRKHKAFLAHSNKFTNYGTYWDEGSRTEHYLVCGFTHAVKRVPGPTAPPQFGGGDPVTIDIPKGWYVVSVGTFRRKTATATVTGDWSDET